MRKFIISLVLALCSFSAFPQIIAPNPNIPDDPVDYSRLRLPEFEPAYPALFTISTRKEGDHTTLMWMAGQKSMSETFAEDKITVAGMLVHTWNITPEFVEECIQKALDKSGIGSRKELARLYKVTPIFKDFTYTTNQWKSDMFGFVTGVVGFVVPGGPVAQAIYGTTTGVAGLAYSNAVGAAGTADNVLGAAGVVTSVAPGAAASAIGNGLSSIQIVKLMYDQHKRDNQKWMNRASLLNMCRIDYFYNLVNMYLRDNCGSFDTVWVLAFPHVDKTMAFQYRGEVCSATWHIGLGAIKLVQLDNFGSTAFDGHYFGYLNADVDFDLSNYDKNFVKDITYEDLLGANGKSDNPLINAIEKFKVTADLGYDLNFYKALPTYTVYGIMNNASSMRVSYQAPIHIKVEAPLGKDENMLETYPDYFWDYYEENHTETELRLSSVMRAMGINIGGRDAEFKYEVQHHKAYTARQLQTHEIIKEEEEVAGSEVIYKTSKGGENNETRIPVTKMLEGDNIQTTIPSGTARILWTTEIQPAPRDAKQATEDQWRELFRKYDLQFNLR
ncbi:MAG: hypothetical protein MJY60_03785 [Bacteroidales bacterium]|nr:hypothetical protein [Bacteroidales bacterium]